ncbi:MAG: aldo/keto reductase [Acidobacteriaceae bacterium]|nr:aldo/keto reductase [Acidobacteriaceae bacterium]
MTSYVTLGRSGLKVSPLCLGTMTFGNYRWGSEDAEARRVFERFFQAGGNFVDTADGYANGKSEELVGTFVKDMKLRDRAVLATKFTFNLTEGNPNSGGNGRKNIYRALEASLTRLRTDYIDLYWMHAWDMVTPVEEVVSTLSDLVREGKVRYYGFSDVPAWYVSRAVTLAEYSGRERPIALQLEYSLVERTIEREHVPAAGELGMGVCPWSPLASGFLADKYRRDQGPAEQNSRLEVLKGGQNPVFHKFTDRNWKILDRLRSVAQRLERKTSQVALNWVIGQPGVTSTILGARSRDQLEDNLGALDFEIPAELRRELDEASKLDLVHPYMFFEPFTQARITGGVPVRKWRS